MTRLLAGRRGVSAGGCQGRGQESAALAAGLIGLLVLAGSLSACEPRPRTGPGLDPPNSRGPGSGVAAPPGMAGSSGGSFGNPQTPADDGEGPNEHSENGSGGTTATGGNSGGAGSGMDSLSADAGQAQPPAAGGICVYGARYPTQLAVHLVLDESLSMMVPVDAWSPLASALDAWISAAPTTQLAVQMFSDACEESAYAEPTLALAAASEQQAELGSRMNESTHGLGAATAPALLSMMSRAQAWAATGSGNAAVVLISSSQPIACGGDANADAATVAEHGLSGSVPTYVLALQAHASLDRIAQAGGTGAAHSVVDPTSDQAVLEALQAITEEARCRYALPADPTNFSQSQAQVVLELTVAGVTTRVPLVASAAECASVADGFYYDDASAPRFAIACAQTCARGGSVDIVLGCSDTGP